MGAKMGVFVAATVGKVPKVEKVEEGLGAVQEVGKEGVEVETSDSTHLILFRLHCCHLWQGMYSSCPSRYTWS